MNAVAVLLNFSSKLTFETTDPLMSIINARGPLLFYDRIAIERLPHQASERKSHVVKLLIRLRNLLECRALSVEDRNEKIRLIITLDLTDGVYDPQEPERKCFPAQKVKLIREKIADIFGENNPLLSRFRYSFIFIDSSTNPNLSDLYRRTAFKGSGGDEWISGADFRLNDLRDNILKQWSHPNDEVVLDDTLVKEQYEYFVKQCQIVIGHIANRLKEANCDKIFQNSIQNSLAQIKTVGEFKDCNYDNILEEAVGDSIGLCSPFFRQYYTFFLVKVETNPIYVRTLGDIYLKSLVQLLSTISDEDYQREFGTDAATKHAKLFVSESIDHLWIDTEQLASLRNYVQNLGPDVKKVKWTDENKIDYRVYETKKNTTVSIDRQLVETRRALYEDFRKKSRIPFFFGKNNRDWGWYKAVLEKVAEIHRFESINDRPLFERPSRITEEDMVAFSQKCSFSELKSRMSGSKEEQNQLAMESLEDVEWKKKLFDLDHVSRDLKIKMVNLGLFKRLLRLALVFTLALTLCYALSLFGQSGSPGWIPLFLIILILLFVAGAIFAHSLVKSQISHVFEEVADCQHINDSSLSHYEQKINELINNQNRADILKRNIDEMQDKYEEFSRHNRQVEIWEQFYADINEKITTILEILDSQDVGDNHTTHHVDMEVLFGEYPSIPTEISEKFHQQKVIVANNTTISNATCFVQNMRLIQNS